jgi:hypothetical protein
MVALGRPGVWRTAADEKVAVALPRSFAGLIGSDIANPLTTPARINAFFFSASAWRAEGLRHAACDS